MLSAAALPRVTVPPLTRKVPFEVSAPFSAWLPLGNCSTVPALVVKLPL